ncbi:primase-like DNA-binding domain-containing protein [Cribrihabitans pelagius]|uniref:primase-like DNA-binding domain-containing protein n=1 Tax=Cribrihabitans pelagius TaxID=1765746 RepID=UPI003B5BD6AF
MMNLTIQDFNGEPRMRDTDIAEALGFSRARDFRKLILRCLAALGSFGEVTRAMPSRVDKHNPNAREYWLNEHQTFYICTQSKTENAFAITRQIINLFVAWRNGRLSEQPEQAQPGFQLDADTQTYLTMVREVRMTKGRAAASWLYDRLPLPSLPPSIQPQPVVQEGQEVDNILLFLQDKCVISGRKSDWIRSRDLYEAYCAYCDEGGVPPHPLRAFGLRAKALSEVYKCPDTGASFRHGKRSDTGFRGLRLID